MSWELNLQSYNGYVIVVHLIWVQILSNVHHEIIFLSVILILFGDNIRRDVVLWWFIFADDQSAVILLYLCPTNRPDIHQSISAFKYLNGYHVYDVFVLEDFLEMTVEKMFGIW